MLFLVPYMLIPITAQVAFAKLNLPTSPPNKVPSLSGNTIDDQGGNIVNVQIVGESKCPDTTKFISNHLLPVFKKYSSRLSISYHPYGPFKYTTCFNNGRDILCSCQHGPDECHKNALQACVIKTLIQPEEYLDTLACIQGPNTYNTSFENCIVGNSKLNQQRIYECSNSREGKALLVQHGDTARRIAPDVFWVPWISIDGLRIPAAESHFEQVLCLQYFQPPPPECQNL